MEQVAIFEGDTTQGLGNAINRWLGENGNKIEVVSRIMSQSPTHIHRFPVVTIAIFYKPKSK